MNRLPSLRLWIWWLTLAVLLCSLTWSSASHAQPTQWTTKLWGGISTCASCHTGAELSHAQTIGLANLKTYSAFNTRVGQASFSGQNSTMLAFATATASGAGSIGSVNRDDTEQIRLYFLQLLSSTAPTANPGSSQTVVRGRSVSLSGSGGATYRWQLGTVPAGSTATLSAATSATASLTPDVVGTYNVYLIVADSSGVESAPARVVVTATTNTAPTANAGANQTVVQGATVTLDGSASSDPDAGTTLTYTWTAPGGITLSSSTAQKPTFTATTPGSFTFGLVVRDEVQSSSSASVIVTVNPAVGVLQAAPSPLTGFSARAGGSVPDVKLLTLTNSGPALSSVTLSGGFTFSSGYSQDATHACTPTSSCCSASTTLAGSQSCQLWVKFLPPVAGDYSAGNVAVGYVASGSSVTSTNVVLGGTATQSTISTTLPGGPPWTQQFGSVQNGFSANQTLTIRNSGDATLNFSSDPKDPARLSGSSEFSIVGGTCAQGTPVAATSGTCTIDLRFAPLVANAALANPRQATLTLASDAGNGPLVVTLTGTASPLPTPSAAPNSLTFTATAWGDTSATQDIVLTNPRADVITYALGTPSSADFVIVDDGSVACPLRRILANGGQCTVKLAFRPQVTGTTCAGLRCADLSVTLTPTSGPAMSPLSVHAVGTAIASLRTSASSLTLTTMATMPVTGSVVVTNQSNASVTLGTIAFSGATASYALDAASTCASNGTLTAGATCVLSVRYSPQVASSDEAVVTVPFGSAGSSLTVDLHGSATALPQGIVQLGASALAFGDVSLGSSASRNLSVHNAGNKALTFAGFDVTGVSAVDFRTGGSCAIGAPLGIGADCTIAVDFFPGALGARTASLMVRSDGVDPALAVALAGNGTPAPAPQVAFSPLDGATNAIVFGNQTVGGIYPARTVQLTNTGTAPLQISGFTVEGAAFSLLSTTCTGQLAPQASCDLLVRFAPAAADTDYVGALKAATNAVGSPQAAPLRGRGVAYTAPVLVWQPLSTGLGFGSVSVGSVSTTQSVVLSNQGPGGTNLTMMNSVGLAAAEFAVGPAQQPADAFACIAGMVLQQGQACRVDVRFVPAINGDRTASLQIVSTGAAPPTLPLSGTGLSGAAPALKTSVSSLDLGIVRQGASSVLADVVLTSSGSGSLMVSAIAATGAFGVQSRTCPATPFVLLPGASCSIGVTFAPTSSGPSAGILSISSSMATAKTEVQLSGQGQDAPKVSSGGCSSANGSQDLDPLLWLLCLFAAGALWRRAAHRKHGRDRS